MTKEMDKDKQLQQEAGAALLDQSAKFKVRWRFGIMIPMGIRPLRPGTIVRLSQESTRLKDVSDSENMIHEMLRTGGNLRVIARMAAVAILNRPGRFWLTGMLSRLLLKRVESMEELFTLMALVYRQMGAEHFFFIMQLTSGMNFLRKRTPTENTAAVTPTGVPSP